MQDRRDFLKGSMLIAGAIAANVIGLPKETGKFPPGIVYTKDAPGRWAGKEGSHAPKVTIEGKNLKVVTSHPMSAPHYIVKHTLLTTDGKVLGEKVFGPTDAAESSYPLPDGFKGTLWITSFCNIHDLWLTEFTV